VTAWLARLDQYEGLGLLSPNNRKDYEGWDNSGGLNYTRGLPAEGYDSACVRAADLWGFAANE